MLHRTALLTAVLALASCIAPSDATSEDFPERAYATFAAESALSVELRTAPTQPPVRGEVTAEVRVTGEANVPRDDLDVDVVAFMPAHGHGAPGSPRVTALGGGRYRIDGLALSMPGSWQLRFTFHGEGVDARATTTLEVR